MGGFQHCQKIRVRKGVQGVWLSSPTCRSTFAERYNVCYVRVGSASCGLASVVPSARCLEPGSHNPGDRAEALRPRCLWGLLETHDIAPKIEQSLSRTSFVMLFGNTRQPFTTHQSSRRADNEAEAYCGEYFICSHITPCAEIGR